MGDYKACSALHHLLKGTLYPYLRTGIYRRCSFVQMSIGGSESITRAIQKLLFCPAEIVL